jgi:KDO2-lipid IV(A) lauroyltransferase
MAKPRSAVKEYAVYLLIRVTVCVLQSLSFRAACRVAVGLAWLAYHLDRRHREVAHDNLRHAFPDWPDEQRDWAVRSVYVHFCTLLMEILFLQRKLHATNWRHFLTLTGGRQIVNALLSGRPLMIVTGHFGNWEMVGYALGLFGFRTHAIARTLDNRYLDDFLRGFRERTGQKVLAKKGDFDQIEAILTSGGVLATLADQDAGHKGPFVQFFGRPASTHKAVALMALQYDVPLLVIGTPRLGGVSTPMRYEVVVEDVILPEEYRAVSRFDAVQAITERFTAALERVVRRAPEQYFWLHRRWKHQPQPKKSRRAA